jgi:peptidoglycan/xylan/chitin deacetylase (PgdA/CDA1 family)
MKKLFHNKKIIYLIFIVLILLLIKIMFFRTISIDSSYKNIGTIDNVKKYEPNEKSINYVVPPKNLYFSIPIFMYHFITDDYGNATDTENFLSPSKLEQQLKYISENGYESIYITDLEYIYNYKKPVALTFDDCFVYFYNNAFPLFKKYNVKASIYVITDYIDGENYLTKEQIKEMINSGIIDVQSHTLSHPKLSLLNNDEMNKEIINSKNALKDLFNIDSKVFCYPYGIYNNKVLDITKKNYEFALDMDGGIYYSNKHNEFEIPRIYANRSMPMEVFINYLKQSKVNANW